MTRRPASSGFTIYEAMMVLLVVAVVVGALTPSVRRQLMHARVNRAANVLASDLFLSQSIASRQRVPVRVTFDLTEMKSFIIDSRSGGQTYQMHLYGPNSDFKLQSMTASPITVFVMPNGMASAALTLTISDGAGYSRQIRMSRAGLIRVS